MRLYRPALAIVTLGLLTFGLVFALLEFSPSHAAPSQLPMTEATPSEGPALASDSLATAIPAGDLAVGVPTAGSEALLRDAQPGDRLDVLASLPGQGQSPPVTVVVVRGATVLRGASSSDPLLLDVQAQDALALAHLVLGGTRLGYVVWPVGATTSSAQAPPLDEATARTLLGLTAQATPVPPPPSAQPTAAPAAPTQPTPTAAVGPASGFLYQVQPGDTWERIASTFGLPVSQIRQWNEAASEGDPQPGRLVFIPRPS